MYIEPQPHVFRAYGRYVLCWRIERIWHIPEAWVKHTYELTRQLKSEADCNECTWERPTRCSLWLIIYLFTYLLTYSLVQSPWEANCLQLVKKFPVFYGTRRFITALTSVRHLSLSWASPIQSTYPHPTSWRSSLILSTHLRLGLPSGLFLSGSPTKTLYIPLSSPIRATCPAQRILLNFITRTYWVSITNHLAPRYAVTSIPPLPRSS